MTVGRGSWRPHATTTPRELKTIKSSLFKLQSTYVIPNLESDQPSHVKPVYIPSFSHIRLVHLLSYLLLSICFARQIQFKTFQTVISLIFFLTPTLQVTFSFHISYIPVTKHTIRFHFISIISSLWIT